MGEILIDIRNSKERGLVGRIKSGKEVCLSLPSPEFINLNSAIILDDRNVIIPYDSYSLRD